MQSNKLKTKVTNKTKVPNILLEVKENSAHNTKVTNI